MSKKKTPPEKKEAEYEKDHYTFAWHSPRGFRRTWQKKKNYRNRVVRRKSKNLQHEVEGLSLTELGPVEESLTAGLFRKGLTKKKVRKTGVVNLREKIQKKNDRRENRGETRRERKVRFAATYTEGIIALERDPDSDAARRLLDGLRSGDGRLWIYLRDNPEWKARLRTKTDQLQKQQQLEESRAQLKQEQSGNGKAQRYAFQSLSEISQCLIDGLPEKSSSIKEEVKKKHHRAGWIFSCFAAPLNEQDLS